VGKSEIHVLDLARGKERERGELGFKEREDGRVLAPEK
jgi:hypothetical protein